jgi:hypothetical protein
VREREEEGEKKGRRGEGDEAERGACRWACRYEKTQRVVVNRSRCARWALNNKEGPDL